MPTRLLAPTLLLALPATASAVTLSLVSEETPYPGITLQEYTTTGPDTNTWVVLVDLCAANLYVDATAAPNGLETAGSWGADVGAQVVVNGDFYATGPTRVYGRAVGAGVPWPLDQTGADPAYAGEWYYEKYGWIAFGHDRVDFTHSEYVKDNSGTYGIVDGWALTDPGPEPPPGTLALVSGFPELVIEGQPVTCVSPTDPSCFPDRSDMRSRHPRTAMGITGDRQTLILAVVDGRTAASDGMYGSELADLIGQLGAYVAFNLDGGGSSQLWLEDRGYVNDASGNNYGSGARAVANHWGIFAGIGNGLPARPGHCPSEPACELLPPAGGTVDDSSDCFRTFGNPVYWREESVGHGGHLYWTNAWDTDLPENWAWWQLDLEEGGEYLVEYWAESGFAVFDQARYVVYADGVDTEHFVDQGLGVGWQTLGTFDFAAGGDQFVAVYDDAVGYVPPDSHVVADALRLTRLDPFCGDAACDLDETCDSCPSDCPVVDEIPSNGQDDDCDGTVDEVDDTGVPMVDTDTPPDPGGDPSDPADTDASARVEPEAGCGCRSVSALPSAAPWLWVALLAVRRRRTRGDDHRSGASSSASSSSS